jgi:hypothetical protein
MDVEDLAAPDDELPEVIIYSHSGLFYWWPVWLTGYLCAIVTYTTGQPFLNDQGERLLIYPGTAVGLTFMTVLLLTIVITNARLRGIYSIVATLFIGLGIVSLAWLGLIDDIARIVPEIAVHMNGGFYLVFSSALLIMWALAFFLFDRLTYWRVRPGQLTQESWIGDSAESFDARGMLFEKHGEDWFRHRVLGMGAGDLRLTTAGAKKKTIEISDVLFVDKKVDHVQRLIMVEPDSLMTN